MSKRRQQQILITHLDAGAQGVGELNRQKITIAGALPGETYQVPEHSWGGERKWDLTQATRLKDSPHRMQPKCPYFGECGGCQLQHLEIEAQLHWKHERLTQILQDIVSPEKILPVIASPKLWHYRRRIQIHQNPKSEWGFYRRQSRRVLPVDSCAIAAEPINLWLKEKTKQSEITEKFSAMDHLELTATEDKVVAAQEATERFFLQGNEAANQQLKTLLRLALETLKPAKVLELFAGSGNFTEALADLVPCWMAVESNRIAITQGRLQTKAKGLTVDWYHAKAEAWLDPNKLKGVDLVFLDPPREGAPRVASALAKSEIPYLWYLSCAPEALARDLRILLQGGYKIESLQPIDFFPHTLHLEVWVKLVAN